MFYQLKDRVRRYRFAGACKGVLHAAPVALDASSNLVVLSQVQHKDVPLYLLAVKSFARQVRPRTVCVLNDGSLSANDCAVLREHVPGVNLLELAEFRSAICPRGGTWERLLAIASLVRDHYVIQLDSDTLTIGPIEEVRHCTERQSAFALGTWNNQKIETMRERCETARKLAHQTDSHVQVVAEANLDKLDDFESLRYVRGCSGFAGFARQSFTREFVEAISGQMQAAIGAKWSEICRLPQDATWGDGIHSFHRQLPIRRRQLCQARRAAYREALIGENAFPDADGALPAYQGRDGGVLRRRLPPAGR